MIVSLILRAIGLLQMCLSQLRAIRDKQIEQDGKLDRILAAVESFPAVGFIFDAVLEGQLFTGVSSMTITDSQKFTASIRPVDAKGNDAKVDGVPAWSTDNTALLTITPATDGMSAEIAAVGPLGSAQVTVSADADLGEGTKEITGVLQVDVLGGQAVSLAVSTSEPTEQ